MNYEKKKKVSGFFYITVLPNGVSEISLMITVLKGLVNDWFNSIKSPPFVGKRTHCRNSINIENSDVCGDHQLTRNFYLKNQAFIISPFSSVSVFKSLCTKLAHLN